MGELLYAFTSGMKGENTPHELCDGRLHPAP